MSEFKYAVTLPTSVAFAITIIPYHQNHDPEAWASQPQVLSVPDLQQGTRSSNRRACTRSRPRPHSPSATATRGPYLALPLPQKQQTANSEHVRSFQGHAAEQPSQSHWIIGWQSRCAPSHRMWDQGVILVGRSGDCCPTARPQDQGAANRCALFMARTIQKWPPGFCGIGFTH